MISMSINLLLAAQQVASQYSFLMVQYSTTGFTCSYGCHFLCCANKGLFQELFKQLKGYCEKTKVLPFSCHVQNPQFSFKKPRL